MRRISVSMIAYASSHEMRSYPLTPRFSVLRSPLGSQSTRLSGYFTRFSEYTDCFEAKPHCRSGWMSGGLYSLPFCTTFHDLTSPGSNCIGSMRTILSSFTWTNIGPEVEQVVNLVVPSLDG